MARFVIFGSVAWDRPIWLDQPLEKGGRILGLVEQEQGTDLAGGRLGGGAANAAACLKNAGHTAAIWSAVRDDPPGLKIREQLAQLDIECAFLHPTDWIGGETLVLIEPNGERTILFQHSNPDIDRSMHRMLKRQSARIDLDAIGSFAPDGIYLRSTFPAYESLSELSNTIFVTHWPQTVADSSLPADVLISSKEDLISAGLFGDVFEQGRKACGERLKWVIVTEGKLGGEIVGPDKRIRYSSPSVEQVDATGAGDAFAAGLLEALVAGGDIVEAVQHGGVWGGRTASLKGCAELRPPLTYQPWRSGLATPG